MRRVRSILPRPAMIIAIVALIAALGGAAYAAPKISFGDLSKGTKKKTFGAGPVNYLSTTTAIPTTGPAGQPVFAACPGRSIPVGGGIRVQSDPDMFVNDSHPVAGGWAGTVFNGSATTFSAITFVICVRSRKIDGTIPATSS